MHMNFYIRHWYLYFIYKNPTCIMHHNVISGYFYYMRLTGKIGAEDILLLMLYNNFKLGI